MKVKRLERKRLKKTVLSAAVVIMSSTLLFQGFIHAATKAEYQKTHTISTNYLNDSNISFQSGKENLPEGYKKGNYTVGTIDLEYYQNQTPTSKDLSKEDAAEIGAQALWEIFDLNLDNQVIKMGYNQASESLPRASWHADVDMNHKLSYYFDMDSVTGELFGVGQSRTLDKEVSIGFDPALDKDPKEYVNLARKLAEEYNVVHSPVKSVEYNSQGYSNNDPDINIYVTGENGEMATMTFSRYDKALLGIGYHTPTKHALEFSEKMMEKLQEKVAEIEKSAPPANEDEAPLLKSIDLE